MTRLFVGGLSDQVDKDALENQFGQYGTVANVDLKEKKDMDGKVMMRFAFVNLEGNYSKIQECVNALSGASWLGSQMKVEIAKESFLDRLKREREEAQKGGKKGPTTGTMFGKDDNSRRNEWQGNRTDNYNQRDEHNKQFDQRQNNRGNNQGQNDFNDNQRWKNDSSNNQRDFNNRENNQWENRGHRRGENYQNGAQNYEKKQWEDGPPKEENKNVEEEAMMSSFEKFSSTWADNDNNDQKYSNTSYNNRGNADFNDSYAAGGAWEEGDGNHMARNDRRENYAPTQRKFGPVQALMVTETQAMKRFYPGMVKQEEEKVEKIISEDKPTTKAEPEADNKYVKISGVLDFSKGGSGGFSFLSQMATCDQDDKPISQRVESEPMETHRVKSDPMVSTFNTSRSAMSDGMKDEPMEETSPVPHKKPMPLSRKKPKLRNFFLRPGDELLKSATEWMVQKETDQVKEEFQKVRPELHDLIHTRSRKSWGWKKDAQDYDAAKVTIARDSRWREPPTQRNKK